MSEIETIEESKELQEIPVEPFPIRSGEANYEKLQDERQSLADVFESALKAKGFRGLITQSSPHAPECWVQATCWTPRDGENGARLRRSVKVILQSHPEMRFERSYVVVQGSFTFKRSIENVRVLDESKIERLTLFLLGQADRLRKSDFDRFSTASSGIIDQLLSPRNRPKHLKRVFIASWRRNWLKVFIVSLFLTLFLFPFSLVPICVSVVLRLLYPDLLERAPLYPLKDPRIPLRYDSWHIVIPEIGHHAEELRESIVTDLENGKHREADIGFEDVWNEGLDSLICRNQIVLSFRRCLVFIEVHAYGEDLYLDWEAFLNIGFWAEGNPHAGFQEGSKSPIVIHDIVSSVKPLEEFDFSDGNFCVEWVHATVKRHLKRLLDEHKVDQEIDFRVIREDRGSMLKEGKARAAKEKLPKVQIFNRS